MAKVQAAGLLALIILAVVLYLILTGGIKIPKIGPITPPTEGVITPTYSNDVITIEDIRLSEARPFPGTEVILSFYLKNNGDEAIRNIEVNFFSPSFAGEKTFELERLTCEEKVKTEPPPKCTFSEIDVGEMKFVELKFKTPSEPLTVAVPYDLRFYVRYSHSGYRIANIPVIDGITVREPTIEFSTSKPTYGPVQLQFEPPVGGREKVDEMIIERYWGVIGRPFKVGIILTHVGSLANVYPINISKIEFSLSRTERVSPCDFGESLVMTPKNLLDPQKQLNFICYFESTAKHARGEPQFLVEIRADFSYTYQFERAERIVVQPLKR